MLFVYYIIYLLCTWYSTIKEQVYNKTTTDVEICNL